MLRKYENSRWRTAAILIIEIKCSELGNKNCIITTDYIKSLQQQLLNIKENFTNFINR